MRRWPRSRLHAGLLITVGILVLATLAGIVHRWPGEPLPSAIAAFPPTEGARVIGVSPDCRTLAPAAGTGAVPSCRRVSAQVTSGEGRGEIATFDLIGDVPIDRGDRIRVTRTELPPGATVGGVAVEPYAFSDFERGRPLLLLTLAFAGLVLISARWRGLRALLGLGASLVIITAFVVPAIVEGGSPVAVALIGSLAVMLTTVILGHGLGPKALAALLGTASALLLTLLLSEFAVGFAHITGLASDDVTFLQATTGDISVRGLLLAGIVIASLGVLDDLTVSQASTVMALRAANPALGARELFRRGMSVGHDHIVATVNTLVLAYVGASLPVLLIFSLADTSFATAVGSEVVAAQVVATLVGSMGLIAAVPITTGLAALLAVRIDPSEAGHGAHAHAH